MRKISLNEKLIVFFMLLGTGAIAIIGGFSYFSARNALMDRTFNQLTSVRTVRKKQIEAFFADRIRDVELIARSEDAKRLLKIVDQTNPLQNLNNPIINDIFDKYLIRYLSKWGYYERLQISNLAGQGIELDISADDTSAYFKHSEPGKFAVSMLFEEMKNRTNGTFFDYSRSGGHGLLVVSGIPGNEGIIILEISPEAINNIMLESNPEGGLGISGESYLIGDDQLFRSESRFSKGNILKLKTNSTAALKAISGQSGTTECADYRGIRVLSSFTKIQVPGLNWFILAEIDKREAMIPVDRLRITILIFTTLTAVAFFILTFLFARHITKPLIKLTKAATSVGAGNLNSKVQIGNNDEIGELAESFNFMTAKLKSQNDQLLSERASRLSSVIDGQEMERQRISREMHDGVGQALSAIGLRLELASRTDTEKIRPVVDQTKMLVDQTIDEVRAICRSLTPPALKEFGPVTAIRRMAEDAAQHAGMQLLFTVNGNLSNPGIKSGTYLYRIAQEAINNVVKHANAQTIEITISINEQNIEFLCKDDGCGFEASATSAGNGILNMKERALLIDGFFSLNSVAGKGTSIVVKIPLASYGTD